MSKVYLARPVTFSGPSIRLTDVPSTVRAAGQAKCGSAAWGGACPPRPPPCCGWFELATAHPLHTGDCFEDAVEGAAAADVAVEALPDLLWRGVGDLLEQADAGHDEAGRAEPAHQRVLVAERLLHRVQRVAVGQPLDVANLLALDLDGQGRARIDRPPVDEHRAGAADATVAATLVPGEVGAHPERIQERDPRLDREVELPSVDVQADRHFTRADHGRPALGGRLTGRDNARGEADDAGRFQEVAAAEIDAVRRIVL